MVLALSRVTLRALDMSFITFSIISVTKNTVQQNGNHMTRTRYTKNSTVGDGIQMHNKQVTPSSSLLYTEEKCAINVSNQTDYSQVLLVAPTIKLLPLPIPSGEIVIFQFPYNQHYRIFLLSVGYWIVPITIFEEVNEVCQVRYIFLATYPVA